MSFDDTTEQPPVPENDTEYMDINGDESQPFDDTSYIPVDDSTPPAPTVQDKPSEALPENNVNAKSVIEVEKEKNSLDIRQAPHNLDIEASLIGAFLRNNNLLERVDALMPEHFYAPEHQTIYNWIIKSSEKGQIASPATLAHYADSDPLIKQLGGKDYLIKLSSDVISIINSNEYCDTLIDLYIKRQLITIGEDLVNDAYENDIENTASEQIEVAEQTLFNLAESGDGTKQTMELGQAVVQALTSAEKAFTSDGNVVGVTSGLRDLDSRLGGLHKSDLLVLAGRPAMGKTALVTNIAFNAANAYQKTINENGDEEQEGGKVLFFSLEMSAEQLAGRILSEQSEISSDKIRRGDINTDQFTRLQQAAVNLAKVPLYIDDTPGISVSALRQRARRLKRKSGLDMIIVDYLQLLQGPAGKKFDNRVNEVSEITRSLKIIAKELEVPVIALSQLSRSVEQREDKRPMLSDLRESGSIEQDADVVMFIYRPEYYLKDSAPEKRPNETEDKFIERTEMHNAKIAEARNKAEVIISKQRHGPTGTVELFFNGDFAKFGDLDINH